LRELLPSRVVQSVTGELVDRAACVLAKGRVVERASTCAENRVARRHQALVGEVVQRGKQLAPGEIAGCTEDNHGLRWR
jgi:hypothetical protein